MLPDPLRLPCSAAKLTHSHAFASLLLIIGAATMHGGEGRNPLAYAEAGISRTNSIAGSDDARAYSFGVIYPINRLVSVDFGIADFGTTFETRSQVFVLDPFTPWSGSEIRRRGTYALATFSLEPFNRVTVSGGVGPAVVFTRTQSYSTLSIAPNVSRIASDDATLEPFAKATVSISLTESWNLNLSAFGTKSKGYSVDPVTANAETEFESWALTLGLAYKGSAARRSSREARWILETGPVVSRLSYHANYHGTPIGYDIAVGRSWANGISLALGHTEFGIVSERPRYPDGTPLNTPPFNDAYQNGDLRIISSSTYLLLGYESHIADRSSIGLAAGPSRTIISFLGVSPVFGPTTRFTGVADETTLVGQLHFRWRMNDRWDFKVATRYTEAQGVQITFSDAEPAFGNTKVRLLSFIPSINLHF